MPDFYGGLVLGVIIGALLGVIFCFAWAISISDKGGKK